MRRMAVVWVACWACGSGGGGGDDGDVQPPCVARSCEAQSANCGMVDDGCGQAIACGDCIGPSVCAGQGQANVCAIPVDARVCVAGWCWEAPAPAPYQPNAAASVAPDDVWVVGQHGYVQHFDGSSWQQVSVATTENLHGIWMASATDGWIVGDAGTVRRWDGATWAAVDSGTAADLLAVAGNAAGERWVVGDQVTLRWDGAAWRSAAASTEVLEHLVVTSDGTVIATSRDYLWQLENGAWTTRSPDWGFWEQYRLTGVAGAGDDVYAIGEVSGPFEIPLRPYLLHRSGGDWQTLAAGDDLDRVYSDGHQVYGVTHDKVVAMATQQPIATRPPDGSALGLVTGLGDQLVAVQDGEPAWHAAAGQWTQARAYGNRGDVGAIAVVGGSVWLGGAGQLLEWNGGLVDHPVVEVPDATPDATVLAIAGTSRAALWVAAYEPHSWLYSVYRRDALQWQRHSGDLPDVHAMHVGADPGDVVLLGDGIRHLARTSPPQQPSWIDDEVPGIPRATWRASVDVGDDIVAVGNDATAFTPQASYVAIRRAGAWTALPVPAIQQLCGVAATADDDVWVVGFDTVEPFDMPGQGSAAHWDGTTWTTTALPGALELCAITIVDGEVWTSGDGSPLYHRAADGTWDTSWPLGTGAIRGLAAASGSLWIAGDHGAVLRRN